MKSLFVGLLLMAGIQSFGQDTCKLIRETDAFTKQKTISSGFIALQGGSLTIDANKQEITLLFSLEGKERCLAANTNAYVFFEGSKVKQTQRNAGTMNCEGLFHMVFRNGTMILPQLKKLGSQKISKVVIIGNNKEEYTITLSPEQQETVMRLTNCVMNEALTLL